MGGIVKHEVRTGGLFTRPVPGGGWTEWADAAVEAARAGIQKSIDAAVLVDAGGGPHVVQGDALNMGPGVKANMGPGVKANMGPGVKANMGPGVKPAGGRNDAREPGVAARRPVAIEGLGARFAGEYLLPGVSHTVHTGGVNRPAVAGGAHDLQHLALATHYSFGADMELALVRAGVPQNVAHAFAATAWSVFQGWGSSIKLPAVQGPVPLAWDKTQEMGLVFPTQIAAQVKRNLGPAAPGPEMDGAIQRFAEWLSTSITRFAADATVDVQGPKLVGGPRF